MSLGLSVHMVITSGYLRKGEEKDLIPEYSELSNLQSI